MKWVANPTDSFVAMRLNQVPRNRGAYFSAVSPVRVVSNSEMSAPETSARSPAPRRTMTRICGSRSSSAIAPGIASHMATVMALRRLEVIEDQPPARFERLLALLTRSFRCSPPMNRRLARVLRRGRFRCKAAQARPEGCKKGQSTMQAQPRRWASGSATERRPLRTPRDLGTRGSGIHRRRDS